MLEALYDATGGADWTENTNWKTDAPLDEWYGVTTDADGRVMGLELPGNRLAGPLPNALGILARLQVLDLGDRWDGVRQVNALTGPIPPALGRLENLESLDLGENELIGPIPDELGRLRNLRRLNLSLNELTGPIPTQLGELTNLRWLSLYGNELTGPIPTQLAELTNLRWLSLYGNELTGPIPTQLGELTNLESLSLGGNELTGPIPTQLGELTNLESLSLGGNELTGPIPAQLGELTNFRWLHLGENRLTGPIPTQLGELTNLESLSLGGNELTGPIPTQLGELTNLRWLHFGENRLTGPIPTQLAELTNLQSLRLGSNELTGPIPDELGRLGNLEDLDLSYAWGVSGPLPPGLQESGIERLNLFVTQACAPGGWRDWLATIDFHGRLCDDGVNATTTTTMDVLVVYTPAAREAAGGTAEIEAVIDLMVAETNQAYETSGVRLRVALVERSEVDYEETGDSGLDLGRLADDSDGHMDEVHALRDRVGADLVHLIVDADKADVGGMAFLVGAFGLTIHTGGGGVFAHELGHNLGLWHDRYADGVSPHPAHGYVNQPGLASGGRRLWQTVMAYSNQCADADFSCSQLFRFSNSRQEYYGDPLGVPYGADASKVDGPADAAAVLNATGPAVALWRDRPAGADRPPAAASAVTPPAATSAVTPVGGGTTTLPATATDPEGPGAAPSFPATAPTPARFTDHPLAPGVTPIRAVHFLELRTRIDAQRRAAGLAPFAWTDPVLRAGATPVRLAHLADLRAALSEAYAAAGRTAPGWTAAQVGTPIRAAYLMELRAAVLTLEREVERGFRRAAATGRERTRDGGENGPR